MLIGRLVELCGEFHHRLLRVQFFRLFCELKALLGMPPILLRGWHKLGSVLLEPSHLRATGAVGIPFHMTITALAVDFDSHLRDTTGLFPGSLGVLSY